LHCILIEKKWGNPLVCDDGVTIAKEVDLEDAEENLAARMLRQAAVAEGVVPGGGLALIRTIGAVESEEAKCEGDEATDVRILRHALEAPARPIVANSGVDPGVVVDRLRSGSATTGFDAATGKYVDLVEAGIIDPTKVVRMALENAVSVAGVLLLAEGTLTEVEDEREHRGAAPELG
jgi:chaperonin GroEL